MMINDKKEDNNFEESKMGIQTKEERFVSDVDRDRSLLKNKNLSQTTVDDLKDNKKYDKFNQYQLK